VTKTFSVRATPPVVLVFFSIHPILWLSFRFLFVTDFATSRRSEPQPLRTPSPPRSYFLFFCPGFPCYPAFVVQTQGVMTMEWTTPKHEEIDLNCEISSYANAEL